MTAYGEAHKRVARIKGPATDWWCEHCDNRASTWAYDKEDPNEGHCSHTGRTEMAFSNSPEHYFPLCGSCHSRFDRPVGPDCAKCGTRYRITPEGWHQCPNCQYAGQVARGEIKRPGIGRPEVRTHCPRGHEYAGENLRLIYREDGSVKQRVCKTCATARTKRYRSSETLPPEGC